MRPIRFLCLLAFGLVWMNVLAVPQVLFAKEKVQEQILITNVNIFDGKSDTLAMRPGRAG